MMDVSDPALQTKGQYLRKYGLNIGVMVKFKRKKDEMFFCANTGVKLCLVGCIRPYGVHDKLRFSPPYLREYTE